MINADRTAPTDDPRSMSLDDLYEFFCTDPRQGLSSAAVADARVRYGANRVTPPTSPSFFWLIFKELFIGFNIILWVAGIFAFLAYKPFGEPNPSIANLALGVILALVIISNSLLNVVQEIKSSRMISSFSNSFSTVVTVRRDGRERSIAADQLVPGDIILLRAGDTLPADCRFLSSEGTGEAVVIAIGDQTLTALNSRNERRETGDGITGLHREVNRFVVFVFLATIVFIGILWVTWGAWLNRSHHIFLTYNENIVNSIGMIVAFLPLGLPSTVTLVLTVVAKKMHRQKMMVKSLQIIETFNAVSVIVTDRVALLTEDRLVVTHLLWGREGVYEVPTGTPIPRETVLQRIGADIANEARSGAFRELLLGAVLCNNGEAEDAALCQLSLDRFHVDVATVRQSHPRLKLLPCNSRNPCTISVHSSVDHDEILMIMKGTPDAVLPRCSSYMTDDDGTVPSDDAMRKYLLHRKETFGKTKSLEAFRVECISGERGCRIIAMCQKKVTRQEYETTLGSNNEEERDYCLVGFFSLLDPPRVEVPDSVLKVRGAQIRVVMVTNDDRAVAKAIAEKVHLFTPTIADANGIRTFERQDDANGQTIFSLYQNGHLLEQHTAHRATRVILEANDEDESDNRSDPKLSWCSRALASCRSQIAEPKSDLPPAVKLPSVPSALLVSVALLLDSPLRLLPHRWMGPISMRWMSSCGTGSSRTRS